MKFLFLLILISPLVKCAFPYYDFIHTSLVSLYAYFNPDQPILTRVAFWGSFVESVASTLEKAIDTCKVCEGKKEEPNWDCAKSSVELAKSVCLNAISIYIGWQHAGTPNGALESADTTVLKRRGNANMRIRSTRTVLFLGFLIIMPVVLWKVGLKYHMMEFPKEISTYLIST